MQKESFLIDINGVLYIGREPVEGAIGTIDYLKERGYNLRFISNATRTCKETLYKKLLDLGFDILESEIFSAPPAAARYIRNSGKNRCFLLATGDVYLDFEREGITLTQEDPNFVVVGDAGDKFNFENLNRAFNFLVEGTELIAMEKDRYWRTSEGLMLDAGPFVTALEYATGKKAVLVGKPSKTFFKLALEDMGSKPERTTVIGDDIFTDIRGAKVSGMRGILVKTGKYREGIVEKFGIKPDRILESISGLKELL